MAYFECVIGSAASGGSGADLIVTCDSVFAGATITCTDGTNTFTQTCPSSSPYTVTFESIPTGTWTISGVYSGQTFSATKTITDFTETLSAIPDGATVTPTDSIQTWLHCANIWDKNYTTIAAVLADTTTLLALISNNNAADYMARSTTWASSVCGNSTAMTYIGSNDYCATKLLANSTWGNAICNSSYFESVLNVKVPTMTSNTTPSGIAFSSSVFNGQQPYQAFDNNDSTHAQTDNVAPRRVGYQFTQPVSVSKISLLVYSGASYLSAKHKLQYSDDGVNFTDTTVEIGPFTAEVVATSYVSNSYGKHSYWALSADSYYAADRTMQFWGRK